MLLCGDDDAAAAAEIFLPQRKQTDGVGGGDGDNYQDCALARRVINSGMLGRECYRRRRGRPHRHPLRALSAHACHYDVFIQI